MKRLRLAPLAFAGSLALAALVLAGTPALAATTTYTITDLGSLGLGISDGYGINANGQVAGSSYLSTSVTTGGCPGGYDAPKKCTEHPEHAFLYANGTMSDLGTLGGNNSEGHAINLAGDVAGWSDTKSGGLDAFLKPSGHKMIDLGTLGPLVGEESKATGINDFGEVVGWYGFNPGQHGFLYSNGTATELPDLSAYNGGESLPMAINNNHQIVGSSDNASGNGRAVLWQNGTITDLGTLGGASGDATAINNPGQIVGSSATSSGSTDRFLYSNGQMTDLGTGFAPEAINGSGVIVGQAAGHAAIYSNGTLQDLNNLIPPGSGYTLQDATAINDNGQIVVNATPSNSNISQTTNTLLLTP